MTGDTPDPEQLVRAVETFAVPGGQITKGDQFRADDPVVADREHLFKPVTSRRPPTPDATEET
jgi:hypothetical protein